MDSDVVCEDRSEQQRRFGVVEIEFGELPVEEVEEDFVNGR